MAIQLLINKKTWPILEKSLGTIPLISSRDLTLEDVASFSYGEMGWFFNEDGTRSIAIRTIPSKLPYKLLDAKHVVVQEVKAGVILLSEKLQPISGIKQKRAMRDLLPSFSAILGAYFEMGAKKTTKITFSSKQITIELPKKIFNSVEGGVQSVPSNAYFVLSTPVLSNAEMLKKTVGVFSSLVDPLLKESLQGIFEEILEKNGVFVLTNLEQPSFLIESQSELDSERRTQFIRTAVALRNPTVTKMYLKDGSVANELISDPSIVPIEERTIEGREFHRVSTGTSSLFLSKNDNFILSDNEETIRLWLRPDKKEKMLMPCDANIGFFSLKKFFASDLYQMNHYSNDILYLLSDRFSTIGIEYTQRGLKLNLCF